jgi:serine/threonine protein kinase
LATRRDVGAGHVGLVKIQTAVSAFCFGFWRARRKIAREQMSPQRWREIEVLYQAAMNREPGERPAFLTAACGADASLREEVAALTAQSAATSNLPQLTAAEPVPDSTQTVLDVGMRLGPYKIVGALGEGGMGTIYRAVDTRLERAVAVKISAERFSERFVREARTISALNHPNIRTLFDVGTLPSGDAFMVTELVEGETLRQWLSHSPGIERGLAVIGQVADALRAAHQTGIVHRDLKPANIMVRFDSYVKVLDFGLAKRLPGASGTRTATIGISLPGEIMGTVAYMSPEQLLGENADARSDLFALEIILYEIAAGRHPWRDSPPSKPCRPSCMTIRRPLRRRPRWSGSSAVASRVRSGLPWRS